MLLLLPFIVAWLTQRGAAFLPNPNTHLNTRSHVRRKKGDVKLFEKSHSRRDYIMQTIGSGILGSLLGSGSAVAAPPLTAGEADNVGARLARTLRPKPPKVLRPKLDLDFAVLLMRSSYNALDELDCVAMDQFQRDFFLIRQAEYQPYVNQLGAGFVKQGELADPYYFDFISFAQYKAINREMTVDPALIFEEKQPVDVGEGEQQKFVSKVIKRDPQIPNEVLPVEHSKRVGQRILERFDSLFAGTSSGLPEFPGRRPNPSELNAALGQLVKLFLLNGFAWDGNASLVSEGSNGKLQFCLTLVSPATIWGGQSLQAERCTLQNDYLMKAAKLASQRYGYRVVGSSVKYEGTKEINYLTLV